MSNHVPNKGDATQVLRAVEGMKAYDDKYFAYAPIAWDGLSDAQREQLNQLLHQGPVWDGNVISKSARDDLLDFGLAVRVCYMGDDGYTAATYPALTVFKAGKADPFKIIAGKRA